MLSYIFSYFNISLFPEIVESGENIDFPSLLDTLQYVNIDGLPPGGGLASKYVLNIIY